MAKKQKFRLSIDKLKLTTKDDDDDPEEEEFLEKGFIPHLRSLLDSAERRLRWLRERRD